MKKLINIAASAVLWVLVFVVFAAMIVASMEAAELPRAWNWCTGENAAGPTPAWQAKQLCDGRPLIPHIEFFAHRKWDEAGTKEYATPGVLAAKDKGLPVVFVYQNVFDALRVRMPWKDMEWSSDPGEHPFQIRASDGQVVRRITFWSNRTDFAYRLGYQLGTKEFTREVAKLYPRPPCVVFADNNETGFVDKREDRLDDVRLPERVVKLQEAIAASDGDARAVLEGALDDILDDASRLGYAAHYAEFRRGFRDGLATHNPHWAAVSHWIAYGQSGNEYGAVENKQLNQWDDYRFEVPWTGVAGQDHQYRQDWGPTGQLYVQPWYGGFHVLRTIIQGDNARWGMEMRESQGFQPPRFQMVWEGRDTNLKERPSREQWRGLVRYWLWVTHSEYFGHFAESQSVLTDERMAVYYDEVIAACDEVHDRELLRDFWLNGEPEPSVNTTPYQWEKNTHPAILDQPRRFMLAKVVQQDRYDERGDKWVRDRTRRQPVNVLALSIRHKDGRRLIYVAGVEQHYESVTVALPEVGEFQAAAPLGGTFIELPPVGPVDPVPPPDVDPNPEPANPDDADLLRARIAELESALQSEIDKHAALIERLRSISGQISDLLPMP